MASSDSDLGEVETPRLDTTSVTMTVTSLLIVLLGAVTVRAARALGIGSLVEPGPGLWPLILGMVLISLGLVLLVVDRRLAPEPFTSRSWRPAVAVVGCSAYVESFLALGPTLPTFVLLACWLRFLSERSWRSALLVSGMATVALYLVFVEALQLSLPTDVLLGS